MCGVRGVCGRPAMMSLCLGVTATLLASASRCLGVVGVRVCLSANATSAFAGEFSFAAERGICDRGAPCLAGVVAAFLPRFADGFSSASSSTSIASPFCAIFDFDVTNGFSCSASSWMTNCARRFARVETFSCASAERVRDVLTEERRCSCLPDASAVAERVRFPRTVGAIMCMSESAMGDGGRCAVRKARCGGVEKELGGRTR